MTSLSQPVLHDFLSFLNASPSPFHTVQRVKEKLVQAGFREVKEKDSWAPSCTAGGKYFVTRNGSSVVAFAIGKKWTPGNPISIIGTHTDSPCLKLKPVSKKQSSGFLQVGVERYGGGTWHTWFDRDLGLAGRAMVRGADGTITPKLVHIGRPLLRIPTLAIHLDKGAADKFEFNTETQLFPITGLAAADPQNRTAPDSNGAGLEEKQAESGFRPVQDLAERHHMRILELVAAEADTKPDAIVDLELVLYDTQQACLGGLFDEFVFSARLDNLDQTYCATMGFLESLKSPTSLDDESATRMIACFDNEEIGSLTAPGAFSDFLPNVIRRLSLLPLSSCGDDESEESYDKAVEPATSTAYEQTLASSFLLAADMAHSMHPNYQGKYESAHQPEMNKGPVIKVNAFARYATNSPGIVLMHEVARMAKDQSGVTSSGIPLQFFVVRNDSSCGSTIGPILASRLGVRTVDLGNAQLSMHSCRETAGSQDVDYAIRLFASFFENYSALERKILVD